MPYPIWRYLNVRTAYGPTFRADGEAVAFVSNMGGVPQVWQVPTGDRSHPAWPRQLTFGEDRVLGAWYAPRGNLLAFARDASGNEKTQLFLLQPETAQQHPVTEGYEEAMHLFGCWRRDGEVFYFAANRRHPAHFDIYRYHLGRDETDLLWQQDTPGFLFNFTGDREGRRLAFSRMRRPFEHDLIELNLRTEEARRLSPTDRPARYTQLAYTPGGLTLYVVTDLDSDFLHMRRLAPASRTWETVLTPNWDVMLMALSPDGRYLAYSKNVQGASHLELIDLARGLALPGPIPDDRSGTAPGVVGQGDMRLSFAPDGRRLAFSFAGATRTGEVYLWDVEDGESYALTQSDHGGLPPDSFIAPQLVSYPTFDEREIPAWFYRPGDPGEKLPVVVFVHGGPDSQYRPAFDFLTQYLVNHGYAVLAPNVRGSTGYGKGYSHLDDVERRMDSVADLAHAAYWLQEQAEIDAGRIAVYGRSYGGFMVLSALANYPELWAAGVDFVGISNFVTFLENTGQYRRALREAEYGNLAQDRDFLERISPLNQVDQIRSPLLVVHGANDARVPLGEARQIVEALQARDVPVEFLVFEDEGHHIVKLKNKQVAYPAVVEFLEKYV